MKRYVSIFSILILLFIAVTTGAAQETLTPGETVEGEYDGDPVVYTVDAEQGQLLIVSMESEEIDAYVAFTEDGEEIAADDDSGIDYNALLAFVAQEDGPYTLEAGASYFGDDAGAFALRVNVVDPVAVSIDEPIVLEAEEGGSGQLYATLEATAGTVVNISAKSTGEDDVDISLVGVDAEEIDEDSNDGPGDSPLLRRVVLPEDGIYLIKVTPSYSDDMLSESVELLVEATEQLYLSETPQDLVLGDGEGQTGTEVYTVDVEAGKTYRFIFTIQYLPDEEGGIQLELLDTARFFDPELEAQHATRVAWDFIPNASGTIRLDVHPSFFTTDLQRIEYTAAMEVIDAE